MARRSRKNVGLIGLGIIGNRIAAALRASGYHVFVWNRSAKPAPNFVGSPAEVAEICDIIQLFVADATAVREVVDAFGDQLGSRHIIINCATIGPEATVDIAQIVQGHGAEFLDAPFTGSKGAAEKGQLVYYVGGEEEVFLRAKPVLEASSRAIVRCGRVGDASTLKIATNLITAVTTQTLAESLAIVKAAGISSEAFAAALEHNACKSGVIDLKLPKMVSGDYEPHFSVKHMFKDVQLGIHMANQQRLEVPLTTVVGGVLYGALCSGWADLDFASLYRVYSDADKKAAEAEALEARSKDVPPVVTLDEEGKFPVIDLEKPAEPAPFEASALAAPAEGTTPLKVAPADFAAPAIEAAKPSAPEETDPEAKVDDDEVEQPTVKGNSSESKADQAGVAKESTDKVEEPAKLDAAPAESEVAKPDEPKADEAEPEERKAEATVASPATTFVDSPEPAVDASAKSTSDAKAEEKSASVVAAADEGEDETGLTGFFSRVFRRRSTPPSKQDAP